MCSASIHEKTTLRHLLAHASGLPFDGSSPITALGRRRIYSNTGIEMVAELITASTGIAFGDYLNEAVIEPLGMGCNLLAAISQQIWIGFRREWDH